MPRSSASRGAPAGAAAAGAHRAGRRRARGAIARAALWAAVAWLALPGAPARAQLGDNPSGYPAPQLPVPGAGVTGDLSGPTTDPFGVTGAPTIDPFGGAPAVDRGRFGVPTTDTRGFGGAPTADPFAPAAGGPSGVATPAAGDDAAAPVRLTIDPPTLALDGGGRALTLRATGALPPTARLLLDVRFDGDRFALTAIEPDPMLAAGGAQQTVKHRVEPGRLRLSLAYTATDASLLPSGLPSLARLTFAPLAAGSGAVTLGGASVAVGADGTRHDLVLDAPATLLAEDAPSDDILTQVRAQAESLREQSVAASELGGGGGPAELAGRIVDRLSAAAGGLGGGDRAPLLAWLGALAAAALVVALGYAVGRTPDAPDGDRRSLPGRLRRRAPGGVDVAHDVIDAPRGGPGGGR